MTGWFVAGGVLVLLGAFVWLVYLGARALFHGIVGDP